MAAVPTTFTNSYSSGMFACFDDVPVCAYGYFCSACQLGQLMEDTGNGSCCNNTMCVMCYSAGFGLGIGPCIGPPFIAASINKSMAPYGVTEEVTCMEALCCSSCATCRAVREFKARKAAGIVPAPPMIMMAAPPQQAMPASA